MNDSYLSKGCRSVFCLIISLFIISELAHAQAPVAIIRANNLTRQNDDTIKLCAGSSINFADGSTGSPTTRSWRFTNGTPAISTSPTPGNVVFSVSGVQLVQLAVSNSSGLDTARIYIDVSNVKPVADFDFNPDNVCGNLPIQFTNKSLNAVSYTWIFSAGDTSIETNPLHALNIVGTGTATIPVRLTATNTYGCNTTASKNIIVQRIPDVTLSSADPDVKLVNFNGQLTFTRCAPDQSYRFVFQNASTTNSTNAKYKIRWDEGGMEDSTVTFTSLDHTYTIGNHELTLTITNMSGCVSIKKYNVYVGTNPGGGISNPSNTDICVPDSLIFPIRDFQKNSPGTRYVISFNDGSPSLTYIHGKDSVPELLTHWFTTTSCGTTSDGFANSYKVTLDIANACRVNPPDAVPGIYASKKPVPKINISLDSVICISTIVNLIDNSTSGFEASPSGCNTNSKIAWNISSPGSWTITGGSSGTLNGSNIDVNGTPTLSVQFNQAGNYIITLYKGNRCGVDSVKRIICVSAKPQASFTLPSRTSCGPLTVTPSNQSISGSCRTNTYQWTITPQNPENCGASGAGYTYVSGNAQSQNPTWNFTLPGKYFIELTASGSLGAGCSATYRDSIIIKSKPRVQITFPATICSGDSVRPVITNSSSCYGTTATYLWDFTGSTPTVTSTSPSPGFITYNNTGNFPIRLTASNDCGDTTISSPLQVVALPTANAGRDTTVCSDVPVTLGAAAIGGYTYQWVPSTGLSNPNIAQPVFRRVNTRGSDTTFQYILTVRIGTGCTSKDTVYVTVRSAPVIVVTPASASICLGDSVLLRASGALTYAWTPANSTRPATGDSVWVKPGSNLTLQATGTDAYGCSAAATAAITVRPLPNTDAGNPISPCLSNEEIPLTGTPAGGIWSGPGVSRPGANYSFNPSVAGLGSHTLYYTVTLNGCSKTDSTLATVSSQLSINAGNDTSVCQNSSPISLKGLPAGGTWSGSTFVSASGIFTPAQAGQFRLTYSTGTASCRVSDELLVTVLPGISNNVINSSQDVCINGTPQLLLGSTPAGGGDMFSYQWQQSADNTTWTNLPIDTTINYQPLPKTQTWYYRRIVRTMMCNGAQQHISNAVSIVLHPDAVAGFSAPRYSDCAIFRLDPALITTDLRPDRNGTYLWFADGVALNTSSSPSIPRYDITKEEDTVDIRLVVQSQWGCRPDTFTRTFITIPGATAAFTKNTGSGCSPVKVKFVNTSSRINGVQHNWDFGNGTKSTLAQPDTITFNGSSFGNDTTYYITLTISNGCTTSVFRDSVKVKPLPKASFGVTSTAICSSSPLEINNVSGGGPATYYWDYGNGDTSISTQTGRFTYTYYTGIADTFLIKMKMINACGTDSFSYNIVVSPNQIKPQVAVNGNQLIGCAQHTVNFVNTTIGASRFIWNFDDGTATIVTSAVPQTVPHTFKDTGTFNVSVRMTNGCSDTVIYTRVIVLSGAKAGFSFPVKPYCEKDSIRFTNTSVNAQSYFWIFGDGNTSSDISPSYAYQSPGKYQVKLVAYRSTVYGTICPDTFALTVDIVPRPAAAISIINPQTTNCSPFVLTVSANRGGALSANWYFDDPLDPAPVSGFVVTHRYTRAGTYRVKLIVFNAGGCADSSFTFVTVRSSPKASFVQLNTTTCSVDTTLSFTNASTYDGADALDYKWLIDGVPVSNSSGLNYRFRLPAGQLLPTTFNVDLVTASSFGCTDTARGTVRMNPTPVAGFTVLNGNDCATHNLRVNNISQYADAFSWYVNNVRVSNQRTPSGLLLSQPNTNYLITLIATNVYGCSPDTVRVTVSTPPRPIAAFVINGDSLSCNGVLNVQLQNRSAGAVSYEWNFGDNSPVEFTADAKHLYAQPGEYTIRLIANNNVCKDTVTKLVRVGVKPTALFDANNATGCRSLTVSFKNLSSNASGYVWNFGDGTLSGQASPDHTYTFNNSPYTVRLIATGLYGCADTVTQLNYIKVLKPPVAAFGVLPSPVIEIPNYTFTFTDRSSELHSPDYRWLFGDGGTSNTQSPSYTYQDTGSYNVRLIIVNKDDGCTDTALQQVKIIGIPGWLQVPNAFQPGSGRSELNKFLPKGTGLKTYHLQIFNTWGEMIFETTKLDDKGRPVEGWDGTFKRRQTREDNHVQQDVYVWKIQATFLNGTDWKGMQYPNTDLKKTGTITVIK